MKRNKILVMMSTYNGEKYLKEQIDSIENQECSLKIDILIRDDGSKDNTVKIIKELNKKYKNISLVEGSNLGCNASFFELFKIADNNYKYYAISDQDDLWMKDKLQRGIDKLSQENQNIPLLYGSCSQTINSKGEKGGITQKQLRDFELKNTIIQNIIPGHSQIFNDKLLNLINKNIDSKKIYVYDYWITNVAVLYGKAIFSNEPSTLYRIHDKNAVGYGTSKIQWLKERLKRFKKGDGNSISSQINYFYEINNENISLNEKKEIEKFIKSKNNIFKRLNFVLSTKLYRQKKIETFLFKVAYLFGKY